MISTFPTLKINIESYPAVKQHLLSFGYDRLKQTGELNARKKTNNKWFETQDSISYWDDFFKPKIIYPNMTKYMPFVYDVDCYLTNQKCFIITGQHIAYLTAFFNSSLFKYCFKDNFPELQGETRELSKIFFDKIKTKKVDNIIDLQCQKIIAEIQKRVSDNQETISLEIEIDNLIFDIHELTDSEKREIGFIKII